MSQVVKCSRLIPQACRLVTRCNSSLVNAESAQKHQKNDYRFTFGTAAVTAVGAAWVLTEIALAKTSDEEMTDLLEESLEEEVVVPTGGMDRMEKWAKTQYRYLLLSDAQRAHLELRDVAPEELVECDRLYDALKLTELDDSLTYLNTVSPDNDEVLWRLARLKWVYGKGYQSNHQHKIFHVAHGLACRAAEVNPQSGDAHRWIAILGFYRAEKEGVKAGVLNMEAMRYHLDRAIELNPDDNVAWTLLGNWYFELADMPQRQRLWSRLLARVDLPTGCYEKALQCFNKSDSIKPWIQNTYWIAKSYLRLRNNEKAIEIFTRLSSVEIVTGEDFRCRKESHIYLNMLRNPTLWHRAMSLVFGGHLENFRIPFVSFDTTTTYNERSYAGLMDGCNHPSRGRD